MADRTTGRRTATGSNPLTEVMEQSPSQLGVTRLGPLVEELKRQQESRLDAVIDSRQVMFVPPHNYSEKSDGLLLRPVDGTQAMEFVDSDGVALRKHALQQIAKTFHIPAKFLYDLSRSKDADLAADLLDGLSHRSGRRLLFRQLDGRVRAILSDRYRFIDNYDLAFQAMETAEEVGAKVVSCSLSDDKMRIKLIAPDLWQALDTGSGSHTFFSPGQLGNNEWRDKNGIARILEDTPGYEVDGEVVWPGCEISNSETGLGSAGVSLFYSRKSCFNMTICTQLSRQVHLGHKMEEGIFSEETMAAVSQTTMMKMRDAIKASFDPTHFKRIMEKQQEAISDVIEAPAPAVDNVVKACQIPQEKRDQLLAYFVGDYPMTRDGLSQAVSRMAQDEHIDADKSHQYEKIAGSIIEHASLIR
tara:strand:+ start:1933 stop:3180 length:1248 start_codon:yes stop_codon:yes gene_type:complete